MYKCKVKLKKKPGNTNKPRLDGQVIKWGVEYEVELSEKALKSEYVKTWFHVEAADHSQNAAEQKAAEQKAAEQKAAEQKAAEQKAAEQKAAEAKAAEAKAAEAKAAEAKAAKLKKAESKKLPAKAS